MRQWIGHLLSLIVGGYFLWAGVVKLFGPERFFQDVLNYQLVGESMAWALALYLPWLEVVAALALLWRQTRLAASVWIGAMLLVFLGALASAWARGLNIDCGCLGASSGSIGGTLLLDLSLFIAVVGVAFTSLNTKKTS